MVEKLDAITFLRKPKQTRNLLHIEGYVVISGGICPAMEVCIPGWGHPHILQYLAVTLGKHLSVKSAAVPQDIAIIPKTLNLNIVLVQNSSIAVHAKVQHSVSFIRDI